MDHFPTNVSDYCCCRCPSASAAQRFHRDQYHYPKHAQHQYHPQQVPLRKSRSVQSRPLKAYVDGECWVWRQPSSAASPQSLHSAEDGEVRRRRPRHNGGGGFWRGLFSPSPSRASETSATTVTGGATMGNNTNNSEARYGTLWEEPEYGSGSDWYCYDQPRQQDGISSRGEEVVAMRRQRWQQTQKRHSPPPQSGRSIFARLQKGLKRSGTPAAAGGKGTSMDDCTLRPATVNGADPFRRRQQQPAHGGMRRSNTDTGGGAIAAALGRLRSFNGAGNGPRPAPQVITFPLARVLPQPRQVPNIVEQEQEQLQLHQNYSKAMIFETSQQHAAAKTPRPKRHEGKPDDTLRKKDEDDSHSVADTDFNEPWDSNAWENLLDLARFGDGKVYAPKSDNTICPSITAVFSPSRLRNVAQEHPGEEDPAKLIQQYIIAISTDDQTVFGATISRFVECTMLSKQQDPYVMIRRVRQFLDGMKNYLVKNGEAELHLIIERESDRLHADEFLNIDAILESVLNKILLVRVKAQLYRLMILETTRNGELGKLTENLAHVRAMDAVGLGFPEGMQMPDSTQMELISKQLRKMQNHYSPLRKFQLLLRVLSMVVPQARLSSSSGSGSDQSQSHPTRRAAPHPQSPHSRHHHHHPQQQQTRQSASSNGSSGGLLLAASATLSSSRHRIESSDTGTGSSNSCVTAALKNPPADELIRWLVYLLARCSTINCEIEAWYMWELLPQQVLSTGDAVYFLSIFFSAVHVLKHPDTIRRLKNVELATSAGSGGNLHSLADFMGSKSTLHDSDDHSDLLLRVAIPNEQEGTIEYHTFPVLPKMNAAKLCRVIAHQFSISNPEDYGLFVLFNGHETCLGQAEFPHLIRDKLRETGKPHLFAYKRAEACIAWPRQAVSHCSTTTALSPSPAQQMMLNKEGAGRQLRIG